eukprot:TRINITY_DN7457_c4_g1_i1.p1 TRINITY_DN7457_c4_g1~~TRINITY_DN7457_c4_g1_i1.p1  ORF type:complete len:598 (+),score=95.99 TRINITY_DN7457_c4_g1_i1:269-2062(+)
MQMVPGFVPQFGMQQMQLAMPSRVPAVPGVMMPPTDLTFTFERAGDRKGIVHHVGRLLGASLGLEWKNPAESDRGSEPAIEVVATSTAEGRPSMVCDWSTKAAVFQTADTPGSAVFIDFRQYEVRPEVYCMAHAAGSTSGFIRTWKFQGSHNGVQFKDIDVRQNDETMSAQAPWSAFATPKLDSDAFYRFLRIELGTDGNSDGRNVLSLNCFEVYGKLRQHTYPAPVGVGHGFGGKPPGPCSAQVSAAAGWQQAGGGGTGMRPQQQGGKRGGRSGPGGARRPTGAGGKGQRQQQQQPASGKGQPIGFWAGGKEGKMRGGLVAAHRGGTIPAALKGRGKGVREVVPREPQEAHPPSHPAGTTTFAMESATDRNGVVFHLGCCMGNEPWANPCKRGAVAVTASSVRKGEPGMGVEHTFKDQIFYTDDVPGSWIQVDLRTVAVRPNGYRFGHRYNYHDYYARTWKLLGSKTGDEGSFVELRSHEGDEGLARESPVASWEIPQPDESFRVFRIVMPRGGNSRGTSALVVSCFDVYGDMTVLPAGESAEPAASDAPPVADCDCAAAAAPAAAAAAPAPAPAASPDAPDAAGAADTGQREQEA